MVRCVRRADAKTARPKDAVAGFRGAAVHPSGAVFHSVCLSKWHERLRRRADHHAVECPQGMIVETVRRPGRRLFMTTIAAAGVTSGLNPANAAPVWTPVPIPAQVPARDAVAELPGTRLWYWDTE